MKGYFDDGTMSAEQKVLFEAARVAKAVADSQQIISDLAVRDAEAKKASEDTQRRYAEFLANKKIEREKARQTELENERKNLEAGIRAQFFAVNPSATNSDFSRVKNSLLDERFRENLEKRKSVENMFRESSLGKM